MVRVLLPAGKAGSFRRIRSERLWRYCSDRAFVYGAGYDGGLYRKKSGYGGFRQNYRIFGQSQIDSRRRVFYCGNFVYGYYFHVGGRRLFLSQQFGIHRAVGGAVITAMVILRFSETLREYQKCFAR